MTHFNASTWLKKIFDITMEKKNQSNTHAFAYQTMQAPLCTPHDFVHQIHAGYKKNAVVYRCVNMIARNLSTVPLDVTCADSDDDTATMVKKHIQKVLSAPNPLHNKLCFFESIVCHLLMAGEVFIQGVHCETLNEMYLLSPEKVRIVRNKNGFPVSYEYAVSGQKKRFDIDPVTGHSDVLHIKLFNPLNDLRGMSPLSAAQTMVDLHNEIVSHNIALLQNAGCPSGALMVRHSHLTDQQKDELRAQLDHFKDKKGAGKMMFLDGDFDWKEMGLSPKEMDFDQGKNVAARSIAQVFGVPPMCIGLLGDSTYSNYQEAHMHLWEGTILPLLDFILAHLNRWIQVYSGYSITLGYQKDHIHALIPRREKAWDRVSKIECLTLNEKRTILGYPPIEGGDVIGTTSHDEAR